MLVLVVYSYFAVVAVLVSLLFSVLFSFIVDIVLLCSVLVTQFCLQRCFALHCFDIFSFIFWLRSAFCVFRFSFLSVPSAGKRSRRRRCLPC